MLYKYYIELFKQCLLIASWLYAPSVAMCPETIRDRVLLSARSI